jgi:hypothetical protein
VKRLIMVICAASLAVPAGALASGESVVKDCTDDGRMSKRYSQKEYRDALDNLPTDVDEYTDCRDVIRKAQLAAAGGRNDSGAGGTGAGGSPTGGSGAGGATVDPATATEQEKKAIENTARAGAAKPVTLSGQSITPEAPGLDQLDGLSTIPTPLLLVLGLLGAAGLAAGGMAGRRLVNARRSA